jgi:hypothetical protein
MDIDELIGQIEECARYCRAEGMSVEINYRLPYVAVNLGKDNYGNDIEYFFQGEEADDLLLECETLDCVSEEDYILWLAQGW